ncbi:hypothetical protein [Paraburkholderia caribensis]|uniref:hypothetical protein n=1 Tax=Paraburkholderia caribensis TaxID=75105 RepID=UPI0034D227AC
MTIFTEFGEGMLFATDIDSDGRKRVVPGSVFRFCSFNGKPATEIYQPEGMSGFVDVQHDEKYMRAFLLGIGFIEVKRESGAAGVRLKHIAQVFVPTKGGASSI